MGRRGWMAMVFGATMAAIARPVHPFAPPAATQLVPGSIRSLSAGSLLVAARGLPDPHFADTVVLLIEHGTEGAMGLIVNRRTEVPLAQLFPALKTHPSLAVLFEGGPVSPDGVFALRQSTASGAECRPVLEHVCLVTAGESLESLVVAGADPADVRVYAGYAGWGPGQLERETGLRSWHVFKGHASVVFDADPASLWQRQIRRTEERMARLRLPASARQASAFP